MLDELAEVADHINDEHADTVGLVGRFLAADRTGGSDAATATICSVDANGVELTVSVPTGGAISTRHDFSYECGTIDEVRVEFLGLLSAARQWIGDEFPMTSLERELNGTGIMTFISEVSAVVDLTPSLRQITFRGGLEDFESLGGDQFLYVLLPPPGRSELTVDSDFSWLGFEEMPDSERPAGAYYSVREWRSAERELDLWFVLHGEAGASSAWAGRARPGQPVALWGPRRSFDAPATTSAYLLVTDETGFGAMSAVLDELLAADPEVAVTMLAETDGVGGRVPFPAGPGVDVTWVDRRGRCPGTTSLLIDAVRSTEVKSGTYAFGAGESRKITEVRKHLRDVVGLASDQVSMTGYWRASS